VKASSVSYSGMADEFDNVTILKQLEVGALEMEGLIPWGSNYTFLVNVTHADGQFEAIYKPNQGERPLWDFARGSLSSRERAAFLASEKLRWDLVPPTILRNGPQGWGSLQYFVDHDPDLHYLRIQGQYDDQIMRIALFDVLANNADRKAGHVLVGLDERIWAIDHGVCFHRDYKLRTVIWEFAGRPIPEHLLSDLVAFESWLCYGTDSTLEELKELLSPQEVSAMRRRVERLIEQCLFPIPGPGRHYPWPLV
jgi:hypothetical protein